MMATAIEFALWAAVLLPLAVCRAFRATWISAAPVAKGALLLMACGLLAVQAIASIDLKVRKNAAFPLTPWTMYTAPTRMVSYWALELEHPDGRYTPYPLEWLDRRHVRTLLSRLKREAETSRGDGDGATALDASLAHLLRMYNQRLPDAPATALRLTSRRQPLRQFQSAEAMPTTIEARVTREQADANR